MQCLLRVPTELLGSPVLNQKAHHFSFHSLSSSHSHPQASISVSGSPSTTPTCFLLISLLCPPPTPVDMCSSLAPRMLPILLHVLNYCPNLSLAATFLKIFSVLFSLLHLSLFLNPLNLDFPTLPGHQKFMCSSHLLVAKCSRYLQIPLQGWA